MSPLVGENKMRKQKQNNLVAKHCNKYNRAVVYRDRKKDYVRKEKNHKKWGDNFESIVYFFAA